MVEGRVRCTTHWGFRNCLFRSEKKKQAFDSKVSRIFFTESSIMPKINSPKAESFDFHRFKFHWNRIIEQLKLLGRRRYWKCKIPWRTFVINSTIWVSGIWIAIYSFGNLRFSIFSYAPTLSKVIRKRHWNDAINVIEEWFRILNYKQFDSSWSLLIRLWR